MGNSLPIAAAMNLYFLHILFSLLAADLPTMGKEKLVYGKDDVLFAKIEEQQSDTPFGSLLDAGTGMHSLRWIATLGDKGMTSFTAVTADTTMQKNVQDEAERLGVHEGNHIIVGNWFGNLDLPHDQYDTILADYLIGALDGFSPYRQEEMIQKLVSCLKPGGRLYIVGLEPIPDFVEGPANVICKVRQVRDACILLAGHRMYREYPIEWIQQQVEKIPKVVIKETTTFPILYRYNTIVRQLDVGRRKFPLFPKTNLAKAMKELVDELDEEALELTKDGPIKFGFDYVVSVQKTLLDESEISGQCE
mmetsp:Transcript_16852/g.25491  ORF Transcript_16852/g.25491 Transcript_16852/m.25491 type:complete len:306 (+) Transcript_16852:87-1004(+)